MCHAPLPYSKAHRHRYDRRHLHQENPIPLSTQQHIHSKIKEVVKENITSNQVHSDKFREYFNGLYEEEKKTILKNLMDMVGLKQGWHQYPDSQTLL